MKVPKHLNRDTLPEFERRLEALTNATQPKWGSLTPAALLSHLRYVTDLSTGETTCRATRNPIIIAVGFFVVYFLPKWPHGAKVPKSFLPSPDGDVGEERTRLVAAMKAFCDRLEREPDARAPEPFMGNITMRVWSRVHGAHLRHHLDQFGL